MKKILIVTPFFVPAYSYGGIVRVAYDHALGLTKNGYEVTVITTDVHDSKTRNLVWEEIIEWIRVIRFKNISNYLAKFQNLYLPIGMKKWIQTHLQEYDIIHIHDIYNLATYWAWSEALKQKKKYFLQPHGTLSEIRIASRKKNIKLWVLKKMQHIFKNASGIFALTKTEIEEIRHITDNNRVFLLPNGIHSANFQDIPTINLQEVYHLEKNTKIISFLGRIQYIKGLDIAFDILAQLNKSFSNWIFLIIGPNEWEKQNLMQLAKKLQIEDKIIWYGEENSNKKYSLLKSSDVFLFTSRAEGFPMTLLEALACKLPVCISPWCNLPEVDTVVWRMCDINNTHESSLVLEEMLLKENRYRDNTSSFVQNYDIQSLVIQLISYYGK